jgi:hypothetical protein
MCSIRFFFFFLCSFCPIFSLCTPCTFSPLSSTMTKTSTLQNVDTTKRLIRKRRLCKKIHHSYNSKLFHSAK